ncbi:MAG: GNAT family protein [Proteobacteria bacterium]|nr:GNAT family protein [Pseudomonadota bacterium]
MRRASIFGQNVYLRPLEEEDIDGGWLDWINDTAVSRHLASSFPVTRQALTQYWANSQPPNTTMFAICLVEDDIYIGNARLSEIDWISRKCKYGRIIGDAAHRGRGLGTEALILLFRYGFHTLGLNRIYSSAIIENEISLASNDKVGMTREGILKQDIYRSGQYFDTVYLAILREDFDRLHGDPAAWMTRDQAVLRQLAKQKLAG